MWKYVKYFLISLLFIIIQLELASLLSLEGITPDILTIWIVYIALQQGQIPATIWGFCIGLMFDFAVGNFIGLSALSKTIAGFAAGYFYGENKALLTLGSYRFVLVVLIASFIHNVVYFTVFTFGSEVTILKAVFQIGLATTFYTAALTLLPMFVFSRKLSLYHG
jgi:rod shape-determining protein MreD